MMRILDTYIPADGRTMLVLLSTGEYLQITLHPAGKAAA
jgi:hypothetical protein